MTYRSTAGLVALVLTLGAAACAEGEVLVGTPPAVTLSDTRWVVTTFTLDGMGGALPDGAGLTLDFDDSGGVGGSAGCNHYFGEVSFPNGGFSIDGLGSTEMACAPGIMEREARFLQALARVSTFTLDGDRLVLAARDGSASIDLVAFVPEPDRPLGGTDWLLTTLINGDAASSVVAGTAPHLLIDTEAGTVTGSTGCNSFGGIVTAEGQSLTVGDLTATEMACDSAVMDQESFVMAVLGAAATWEVDGTLLRITAADGRALEFRAA